MTNRNIPSTFRIDRWLFSIKQLFTLVLLLVQLQTTTLAEPLIL